MTNDEIKTIWKLTRQIWIFALVFWLSETFIFLIIEGWHIKATNPIEIYLDKIFSKLWDLALLLSTYCGCQLILNLNKKTL